MIHIAKTHDVEYIPRAPRTTERPPPAVEIPGYTAMHQRVHRVRGKASWQNCRCGEPAQHWANLTGNYADVNDYEAMCMRCHRHYDGTSNEHKAAIRRSLVQRWGASD